jgi:hypothetical protein
MYFVDDEDMPDIEDKKPLIDLKLDVYEEFTYFNNF